MYKPNTDYFTTGGYGTASAAVVNGIKVENSTSPNFLFVYMDQINITDVELYNNFLNDTDVQFSIFYMNQVDKVIVNNVYGENQYGSVFRMDTVLNQQFYNCSFKNFSVTQASIKELLNIVHITRSVGGTDGLDPTQELLTIFNEFHVNVINIDEFLTNVML